MKITELIRDDETQQVLITMRPADLKEFALELMEQARTLQAESQAVSSQADEELTAKQAARQLGVSTNTLWRWEKEGYLTPHGRIGKRPIYLQSQLNALKGTQTPGGDASTKVRKSASLNTKAE